MKRLTFLTLLFLLLTACGSNAAPPAATTTPQANSSLSAELPSPAPTSIPTPDGDPLDQVRAATVRIGFKGSFLHYAYGQVENLPNHGSGFIIDPSGIAVTNHHVVTGAAFLEVQLDGETQPRNARVLGVSECADLAVIDIDGDGFPTLDWYDGPVTVGMDVYAAGFPVYGNTEYTLTRGVIAKEETSAEFHWSSVDKVYEIDATIQGGNSGGPLVTAEGDVIGVNYAGNDATRQGFTIAREVAQPIVAQLQAGLDVDSIGINGEAVSDGETLFGIWVSSVASGSPADEAGVRPGDVITHLEGLQLALDGSMSAYCDVLRSRDADDVMAIQVLRVPTGIVLTGQLNGQPLSAETRISAPTTDSSSDSDSAVAQPPYGHPNAGNVSIHLALSTLVPDATLHEQYSTVSDDSGAIAFDAPAHWTHRAFSHEVGGFEGVGIGLVMSPVDPATLTPQDADVPVFVFHTRAHDLANGDQPPDLFSSTLAEQCISAEAPQPYSNETLIGTFQAFSSCNGHPGIVVNVELLSKDGVGELGLTAQVGTLADMVAIDRILNSFAFTASGASS